MERAAAPVSNDSVVLAQLAVRLVDLEVGAAALLSQPISNASR